MITIEQARQLVKLVAGRRKNGLPPMMKANHDRHQLPKMPLAQFNLTTPKTPLASSHRFSATSDVLKNLKALREANRARLQLKVHVVELSEQWVDTPASALRNFALDQAEPGITQALPADNSQSSGADRQEDPKASASESAKTLAFRERNSAQEEAKLNKELAQFIAIFVICTGVLLILVALPEHIIEKYVRFGARLFIYGGALLLFFAIPSFGFGVIEHCTKKGRQRILAGKLELAPTMTIAESTKILGLVNSMLADRMHPTSQRHPSVLNGYNLFDVFNALNLLIANEYLELAERPDFEARFSEGLKIYDPIPYLVSSKFMDYQDDNPHAPLIFSLFLPGSTELNPAFDGLESGYWFANLCEKVGWNNPLFWQEIYTHLDLRYTSSCPQGNVPSPDSWSH